MPELSEKELLQLKNKLPRFYASKIQEKYKQEFGRTIRKSSIYRGLTYKTRSNNIIEIALVLIKEDGEKQDKIREALGQLRD